VLHWFYLIWLREVPQSASSAVPLNLLLSEYLTAPFMGLYANVLRSGGLPAVSIAVLVNLLRAGGQTIGVGEYANVPRSGGA